MEAIPLRCVCLHLLGRGRWIADEVSETEGDGEVLTVVSTPSSFDGRTLRVLLRMRAIGLRCCAAVLFLIGVARLSGQISRHCLCAIHRRTADDHLEG
jgi:hypothetical protein